MAQWRQTSGPAGRMSGCDEHQIRPAAPPSSVPRILVIDDEDMVRNFVGHILESEHFEVCTAKDGGSAVDLFRRGAFSLVILDWHMPGLSGESVFDSLAEIRPGVKVIVASGECPEDVKCAFHGRNVLQFIPKPFPIDDFVAAVKTALAA